MYYIQESDKPNKIWKTIKIKNNQIILPIGEKEITDKQAEKLAQKTKKILQKSNGNKLILSKKIKKQEKFQNYLITYCFEIQDGKWLFEVISYEVLEYILKKKKLEKKEESVSILVNQLSEITLENIKKIAKEYKSVNIVTNHIGKLKNIQENMLEEEGIMITVTNNKKKSLMKSKIILNIDFPSVLLNQYQIKEDAIIINIQGNVEIKKKRFNGICINDYEIEHVKESEYENIDNKFSEKEIYEAQIYKRQPVSEINKKIKKDGIEIKYLQGVRQMI